MIGATADKWHIQGFETVLCAAMPKLGKTLFASTAPTPMVIVACDLGKLSIAPGVDREKILVLPYQELTRELGDMGTTVPKKDVFTRLMRDLYAIGKAVKQGEAIKLEEGKEFPPPQTIVIDGFTRLNSMVVDGKLALNNLQYSEDLDSRIRFNFWGKRLTDIYTIVQQYASLPVNVVITSWVKQQVKTMDGKPQETGAVVPDIGGAMDIRTAGVVGSSLLMFARGGRYYVRTKPDGIYPWCGVRDQFTLPSEVDVTLEAGKLSPWERVFGVK